MALLQSPEIEVSHNTMKASDTDTSEESQDELAAGVLCCGKAEKQTGASGMQRTDCSANARDVLAVVVTRWFNAASCARVRSRRPPRRQPAGFACGVE